MNLDGTGVHVSLTLRRCGSRRQTAVSCSIALKVQFVRVE